MADSLEFQVLPIVFDKGLDTTTQKKLVVPGKWDILENLSLSRDNTPQRRDGFTALVPTANGNGLATHNNELLTIAGGAVSSVSTAPTLQGGAATATQVDGNYAFVEVDKSEIKSSTGMQDSPDVAHGAGYTCYVWRDLDRLANQTGLNVSLVDETTGNFLINNQVLRTGTSAFCPRVIFSVDSFFIFYIDGNALRCRLILASAPSTLGPDIILINNVSLVDENFDACNFPNNIGIPSVMVAYLWNDGTTSVQTIQVVRTGSIPSINLLNATLIKEADLPVANICAITCLQLSATRAAVLTLGFGANVLSGTSGVTIDENWNTINGPLRIVFDPPPVNGQCHITATMVGSVCHVLTDRNSSYPAAAIVPINHSTTSLVLTLASGPDIVTRSSSFGGGASLAQGVSGPWIHGRAFTSGTSVFLPVVLLENYQGASYVSPAGTHVTNNQQNSLFVFDCTVAAQSRVVAKALYGSVGFAAINGNPQAVSTPCSVVPVLTGGFRVGITERTLLSLVGGFNISPTGLVGLRLTPNVSAAPIATQLGESTYIAGGSLTAYDGASAVEHGFPLFPEGIGVAATAGGALTAGVYQVVAIYEWVDNAGQRHQSAPSLATTGTTAAGNLTLTVKVPTLPLHLTNKTGVVIVLYVTQPAGTTFNRVASSALGPGGTPNDPTVAFVTMTILDAPSVYAVNELLYTQPNLASTTLPNLAPGPCKSLTTHQNRVFVDRSDQANAFAYSQPYVNNLGLQFNPALGGFIDVAAGGIVGFAEMDEKVIIFGRRRPFVVYGTGPDASGSFSQYSDPQPIPTDVGCVDARTILRMPNGVIFKSAKGWYLLGRDLAVSYIGGGVQRYDDAVVTSAVLLEDRRECRFTCSFTGENGTGFYLCYSYQTEQWSTATSSLDYSAAAAIWWPTISAYCHIDTSVFGLSNDTPGIPLDSPGISQATHVITTMQTSYLHLSAFEGFQRVRWLYLTATPPHIGNFPPASSLVIAVDYDDVDTGNAPGGYSFSVDTSTLPFASGVTAPIDLRTKLRRQKCKSIRFRFTETPDGSSAFQALKCFEGYQALALQIGIKKGTNKLPAAATVG